MDEDPDETPNNSQSLSTNTHDQPTSDTPFTNPRFKNKSTWTPPSTPPSLSAFITSNEVELSKLNPMSPKHHNLSLKEKQALKTVAANRDITIKRADKGSAVVVMNTNDYINECTKQLSNPKFYGEVAIDLTETHRKMVNKKVLQLFNDEQISEHCKEYLCHEPQEHARTPLFYTLPKIHKGITPFPPGRPIVSGNDSPTERISEFVDFFLQPCVPNIKSYIKDTTDFINKIEALGPIPPNSHLVTLDVSSLYTNIPSDEGREATQLFLQKHRTHPGNPSNSSLDDLLKLVLTKNNFDFNNRHYLQISGTAMGTKVAPSFANVFMSEFEEKFVYPHPIKPIVWFRFIDDIFAIFTQDKPTIESFIHDLNNCHHSIKFTAEISQNSISFLDTTISIQNNRLHTNLYCKPTDSHNYLQFDSYHAPHVTRGIPYGQFLRLRRICCTADDFEHNAKMLTKHFLRRGYPPDLVTSALSQARLLDRQDLLHKDSQNVTTPNPTDRAFAITTYQPGCKEFNKIIQNNWGILGSSPTTRHLYDTEVTYGHRRPKNLSDFLVRARVDHNPNSTKKIINKPELGRRCIHTPCEYCPKFERSGKITSKATNRTYTSKTNFDCESNNLIYAIECRICGLQYVGQTGKTIQQRFYHHFWQTRNYPTHTSVARHFNSSGHHGPDDMNIYVLSFAFAPPGTDGSETERLTIESGWIHRLKTNPPYGLNVDD